MTTTVVNLRHTSEYDVNIMRPGPWGNPFSAGHNSRWRDRAIRAFRAWIHLPAQAELVARAKRELKGKRLGCCCKPRGCHGDVWAEVVDAP